MKPFRPAWWLPGPHAHTLWGKLFRREPAQPTVRERWTTPDGDFIDVHRLKNPSAKVHLVILHGLEGTVRSSYAQGLLGEAKTRGWAADMLIFRSCSEEMNLTRRFYHSGETTDLGFVIDRLIEEHPQQILCLVGVSLGGNVLLKYLGERGKSLPESIKAAVAISVPFDLERASRHIDRGFAKVYQRHFVRSLKRKALVKLVTFPDLVDRDRLTSLRTMYEFDNALTAPLHGFDDARHYYSSSSSLEFLKGISIPTLLLSAVDDPFLPPDVLNQVRAVADKNRCLHIEFTEHGGHVGFVEGRNPFRPRYYAERRASEFAASHVERSVGLPSENFHRGEHVEARV
ncbi:MAG TPA: hydrolase [Gemmatimonadaceae bacterium]|nr:hydrolase [Gemmatimonadaceae bacterium]